MDAARRPGFNDRVDTGTERNWGHEQLNLRRGILVVLVALLGAWAMAPTARAQPAGVAVVELDGKGFGHGVGLSQWGARYMAEGGEDHSQILSTFYPGTTLTTSTGSQIRVAVYNAPDSRATFTFPNGGQVLSAPGGEQAPGFPIDIAPGDAAAVSFDGATYHVSPIVKAQAASAPAAWQAPAQEGCIPLLAPCAPPGGGGTACGILGCVGGTTPPPPPTEPPTTEAPPASSEPGSQPTEPGVETPTPPTSPSGAASSSPVWAAAANGGTVGVDERGRHYRGLIEATAGGGPLRLVDQLDVETYLKGMGEVPGSWPLEAVAAQSVVARTYALRAMSASGELCDYDLCQVYLGADNESAGQNAGVNATAGQVLTYADSLATTVYSADAGGISATTLEGFGNPDNGRYPYLTTVRYNTPNPLPWHSEVALSDVAARFGYRGTLESISIGDAGPSGRALTVLLQGSSGPSSVDGRQFASSLGLRSTLFTASIGSAATAPAAPTAGAALQLLPDDSAALHAAARSTAPAAQTTKARPDATASSAQTASVSARAVADLAAEPATWAALALLVLVTAIGLGRGGSAEPAFAFTDVSRQRLPDWVLWSRDQRRARAPDAPDPSSQDELRRPLPDERSRRREQLRADR
ncbi:MAG: SpoIID/LytB domain-containing protein [Acidimicrobiales bacterium]